MKRKQKKIIHLSDIHCGYKDHTAKFEDIVTRIIFHKTPGSDYVVVITGDLVDNAHTEGLYSEVSTQLGRLTGAGFHVLPAPGNHDYGTGVLGDAAFVEKFKKHFYGDGTVTYPKLDIIENTAFICLDSMAEELHWYDKLFAQGELGEPQLKRLDDMLNSRQVKKCKYTVVYLHHHPFHPTLLHQLKDSGNLRKILIDHKINALLFGHEHRGDVWNGAWNIKRAYDAGSTTGKRKQGPHRVINLSVEAFFDYDAKFYSE